MAQLNFDATQVAPNDVIEAIPAGWYNAMIDQSEMKPAKTEGNFYLQLRFTILDGQYANRKVFTMLNLRNNNPTAQEIAYRSLSAICHAVGMMQVGDSSQLHGLPMKIKVKVRPATADYDASNEIQAYKNINEVTDTGAASAPAAAPWAAANTPAPAPAFAQPAPAAPAPQYAPAPTAVPANMAAPAPASAPAQQWAPPAAPQPWAAAPAQAPAAPAAPAPAAAPGAAPPWATPAQ